MEEDREERHQLVPKIWTDEKKGLVKELISFKYMSMTKANELSRCLVNITDIANLEGCESEYLKMDRQEYWIDMSSALTPIDCYVERFLMNMLSNEKSKCTIKSKSKEFSFVIQLLRVQDNGHFYQKTCIEMYELAKKYKENGVKMFAKHPLFAHKYFSLAAKCLLSFQPIEDLDPHIENIDPKEMKSLLDNLYLNISACLIKQDRYEEVLYCLNFVDKMEAPPDKAVYRKALDHFHVKQFEEAKILLERIDYRNNADCMALYTKVMNTWRTEKDNYNSMVKKMFG